MYILIHMNQFRHELVVGEFMNASRVHSHLSLSLSLPPDLISLLSELDVSDLRSVRVARAMSACVQRAARKRARRAFSTFAVQPHKRLSAGHLARIVAGAAGGGSTAAFDTAADFGTELRGGNKRSG